MRADKIYLVGFMGAGKSTLATAIGARLDWRVEDIDTLVEQREHLTVAEIFAQRGERHFRDAERAVLAELLPTRHAIIATGGGTYADPGNRSLINRDGVSMWLDVSLRRVIERLPTDGRRPLASNRSEMERLFRARQSAYRHSHVRLDADRASTGALVEQVVDWLES
jgi:shikimate kinase